MKKQGSEPSINRASQLGRQGFYSIQQCRPSERAHVEYDLLFLGERVTGHKRLPASGSLEADDAINPIDAALLLGAGPCIESVYWRLSETSSEP